jgi:hypothetical protein
MAQIYDEGEMIQRIDHKNWDKAYTFKQKRDSHLEIARKFQTRLDKIEAHDKIYKVD